MSIPQFVDGETDLDSITFNRIVNRVNAITDGTAPIALPGIEGALGEAGVRHLGSGRANILDYNEHAGDGSTSINSLITEMVADTTTNDVLEFPPGSYLLTGQWTMSVPRHVLFHPGATVVLADGANAHAIRIQAPGCRITGGVLDANGANQTGDVNGVFIGHRDATDCVIEGLTVLDAKYVGIRSQAARTKLRFCTVRESKYTGIFLQTDSFASVASQADSEVVFCTVDRSGQPNDAAIGAGIQSYGDFSDGLSTIGTKIIGNTVRMPLDPTNDNCLPIEIYGLSPGAVIANNTTHGGSFGISVNRSERTVVQGNVVADAGLYGIECADTDRMVVVGNTMQGRPGALQGVSVSSLTDTEQQLIVANNYITGFEHGAHIQKHARTSVAGNVIEVPASGIGVALQQSERTIAADNYLYGAGVASHGVRLDRSSHVDIHGNTFDGFASGINVYANTSYVFEHSTIGPNTYRDCADEVAYALSGGGSIDPSFVVLDDPQTITGSTDSDRIDSLIVALVARGGFVDGTS